MSTTRLRRRRPDLHPEHGQRHRAAFLRSGPGRTRLRVLRRRPELHRGHGRTRPEISKPPNVYQVWIDLPRNASWTLARSLLAQPGAGQQLTGAFDFINSLGARQLQRRFVSFTAHDWHGLTTRSNFTWGESLGTGSVVQASSSISVPDPYNFNNFGTYGAQPFDVKYTYSLLMLYQSPFFKSQKGVAGHILGGWTIAPLFTARSGLPLRLSTSSNGEAFGEVYSGQTANYDSRRRLTPFTGGNSPNYNVQTTGLCTDTRHHRPEYFRDPAPSTTSSARRFSARHQFRWRWLAARLRILEPRRHRLQGLQSHRADRRHAVLPVREYLESLRAAIRPPVSIPPARSAS